MGSTMSVSSSTERLVSVPWCRSAEPLTGTEEKKNCEKRQEEKEQREPSTESGLPLEDDARELSGARTIAGRTFISSVITKLAAQDGTVDANNEVQGGTGDVAHDSSSLSRPTHREPAEIRAEQLPSWMYVEPVALEGLRWSRLGAYGNIYRVPQDGAPLAVKQRRFAMQEDEKKREDGEARAIREALFLVHLQGCSFVVPFIGVFYTQPLDRLSVLNIVMPWLGGGSLLDWINSKSKTTEAVRDMILQVAEALRDLHGRGVAHNDVALRNILLDGHGHPVLCDLGNASIIPTIAVAADEETEEGLRLDVRMFGAVCYELLTGTYVRSACLLFPTHRDRLLRRLQELSVPRNLREIVRRAWEPSDTITMDEIVGKNNRASSRSPAPRSSTFKKQDQPRFFPPSYYAAAAGVHQTVDDFQESPAANSPIPVAYPSDSASDSPLPGSRLLRRTGSISSKKSLQSSSTGKSDRSHRRKTQLESIEAQLLPSLRDTIDRMTQPNSQASPRPESVFSPHLRSPAQQYRSQFENAALTEPQGSSSAASKVSHSVASPSLTPRIPGIPRDTPTLSDTTPRARPISILKSTPELRSLAMNSPVPRSPHRRNGESPKVKSLRSARTVSGRTRLQLDSSDPEEGPLHDLRVSHVEAANKTQLDSTWRSRAGTVSAANSPTPQRSTVRAATDVATSHLPRRLGDSRIPGSRRLKFLGERKTTDDSSSSEVEYDAEGRNSRVLIVANAEVVPSSSSESDGGKTLSKKPSRLPVFSGRNTVLSPRKQTNVSSSPSRAPIGLGLDIRDSPNIGRGSLQARDHIERYGEPSQAQAEEDDASVYEDDSDHGHGHDPTRQFGRPSTSEEDISEGELARQRRQEALVNIVDDLQSTGTLAGVGNAMLQSASDCAASGSWHGGLAISGSKDFVVPGDSTSYVNEEVALAPEVMTSRDDSASESDYSDDDELTSGGVGRDLDRKCGQERGSRWASPSHNHHNQEHSRDGSARGRPRSGSVSDKTSRLLRPLSMPTAPSRPPRPEEALYPPGKDDLDSSEPRKHGTDVFGSSMKSARPYSMAVSSPSRLRSLSARHIEAQSFRASAPRSRTSSALGTISRNDTVQHDSQDASGVMSKSDSYSSSVGEMHRWREQSGIFSHGAEALFERLGNVRSRRQSERDERRKTPTLSACHEPILLSSHVRSSEAAATTSGAANHETTGDSHEFGSVRQTILEDLYISERDFLAEIRPVVAFLVQPLRKENRKSWISGMPTEIASFFDWFEDIVNFHAQFSSILRFLSKGGTTAQERICQTILRNVPKMEVYQPYLVQVESVVGLLDRMILDKHSDFGEFVRIQQDQAGVDTSSLKALLFKPRERLSHYLTVFQVRVPNTSTRMIVKVMLEVKLREDEYQQVKELLAQIDGLPNSETLAKRERRLLSRGHLRFSGRSAGEHALDSASGPAFALGGEDVTFIKEKRAPETSRQSRLSNAVLGWDTRRSRSQSIDSAASSLLSFDSVSSGLSGPGISSSGSYSESRTLFSPSPAKMPKGHDRGRNSLGHDRLNEYIVSDVPVLVLVLVFTDLLILAKPHKTSRTQDASRYLLLQDVGLARILEVGSANDASLPMILDLLPVDVKQLETGEIPGDASLKTVRLGLEDTLCEQGQTYTVDRWLEAFRNCARHTLRSLSFPSHSGQYLAHGSGVDLEHDTRQAVMSILSSGLPMPKSPSVQILELHSAQDRHLGHLERESRGWWAMRFQQVYREMQRMEIDAV
ncbi:hypothetical protein OE88DRAFT_1645017 [Heliocybe sulcata]|uniref:Non-specific serine/threonine protein kinase n=1 Tax=Heliocybe sulcata TaxID=5364 RepID=A0A5C3N1T7_9AGAM|nr:hypothetical protein OE88DRAFT_1645017 [Heliocybe sulcata]